MYPTYSVTLRRKKSLIRPSQGTMLLITSPYQVLLSDGGTLGADTLNGHLGRVGFTPRVVLLLLLPLPLPLRLLLLLLLLLLRTLEIF